MNDRTKNIQLEEFRTAEKIYNEKVKQLKLVQKRDGRVSTQIMKEVEEAEKRMIERKNKITNDMFTPEENSRGLSYRMRF